MPNQLPEAVLWDMDGTLIDSEPYWLLSQNNLAAEHGMQWGEEHGHHLIGKDLKDSSAYIKEKMQLDQLSIDEIINRLTNEVIERLNEKLHWRPGALELLIALKQAGIKTALVTMSMRRMALAVVEQIPFQAFDVVIAGDDVSKGKPDPEPYLLAATALGVRAQDCVAFEDSNTGLTSAEAAGTLAIGIPSLVPIPPKPGRRLMQSLEQISINELQRIWVSRNG